MKARSETTGLGLTASQGRAGRAPSVPLFLQEIANVVTVTGKLRIENAETSDFPAIAALLRETDLPPDDIEHHLDAFLVVRSPEAATGSGILLGSVGLEIHGKSALLRSLAVHPDFQRNGLGKRLVSGITQTARERGITRLYLLTDTAEDFFKRLGFKFVSRDEVPEEVKQSIEFTTLCTESPSLMKEI
jgi:N-acetylglutamate synthase-like GNAT family acetyltransferase